MALRDIPPDAPGVPWKEWQQMQVDRIFAEARERRLGDFSIPASTDIQRCQTQSSVPEPLFLCSSFQPSGDD
jgi:hypothetical protein